MAENGVVRTSDVCQTHQEVVEHLAGICVDLRWLIRILSVIGAVAILLLPLMVAALVDISVMKTKLDTVCSQVNSHIQEGKPEQKR